MLQKRKEIATKWRKLSPKEKAAYGSSVEGRSGEPKKCREDKRVITRCSPDRFHALVEKLSDQKRTSIEEIGFGTLSALSCTRLNRPLCNYLVQKLDPSTCSIELHGKVFELNSYEFGRVMGLEDSGSDVVLGGLVMDDEMKQLYEIHCGGYKRAMMNSLVEKLCACKGPNDNFKVGFVLFALGTVLCPTSALSVSGKYLSSLRRTGEIKTKNWARHGFKYLIKGVKTFKDKESVYMNRCLLFLQLF